MQHRFFALISRMRYIGRWGLMRNTFDENIQEHSPATCPRQSNITTPPSATPISRSSP